MFTPCSFMACHSFLQLLVFLHYGVFRFEDIRLSVVIILDMVPVLDEVPG